MMRSKEKNIQIEFLRIFFSIVIILYHFGQITTLRQGYIAVEFFFLLSGFLLAREAEDNLTSAKEYTMRKLRKIYPAYLLNVVLFFIIAAAFHFYKQEYERIVTDLMDAIPEVFMLQGLGIFSGSLNYPMWYLAVLIPGGYLVYWGLNKAGRIYTEIIAPVSVVVILAFLFHKNGDSIEVWGNYGGLYIPMLRGIADLNLGIIIYHMVEVLKFQNICRKKRMGEWIKAVCFLGVCTCIIFHSAIDKYAFLFLSGLIGSCFLWGKTAKSRWYFYMADLTMYTYMCHALVIRIFQIMLEAVHAESLVIKIIINCLIVVVVFGFAAGQKAIIRYFLERKRRHDEKACWDCYNHK